MSIEDDYSEYDIPEPEDEFDMFEPRQFTDEPSAEPPTLVKRYKVELCLIEVTYDTAGDDEDYDVVEEEVLFTSSSASEALAKFNLLLHGADD